MFEKSTVCISFFSFFFWGGGGETFDHIFSKHEVSNIDVKVVDYLRK